MKLLDGREGGYFCALKGEHALLEVEVVVFVVGCLKVSWEEFILEVFDGVVEVLDLALIIERLLL